MKKTIIFGLIMMTLTSCINTKNTIKNIDNNAPLPILLASNSFELKEMSPNKKYGYDPDYPINVYYLTAENDTLNAIRFLKALAGPKGETIHYEKKASCCPFSTKQSKIGAGFLEVYEVSWDNKAPKTLYFNVYEKGYLYIPQGFSSKSLLIE